METASACQPTPVKGGWSVGAKYFSALVVYVLIQHLNNKLRIPHFSAAQIWCTITTNYKLSLRVESESTKSPGRCWEDDQLDIVLPHTCFPIQTAAPIPGHNIFVHCRYCQYLSLAAVHFNYITFQTKTFVGWGEPRNPLFFLPWHSQIFSKRRIKNCNNTTFNQQWTCSTQ